jgi:hypothetical protein
MAQNDGMIIMNWKGCGRIWSWLNFKYCPGILSARTGINNKIFTRIASLRAEI